MHFEITNTGTVHYFAGRDEANVFVQDLERAMFTRVDAWAVLLHLPVPAMKDLRAQLIEETVDLINGAREGIPGARPQAERARALLLKHWTRHQDGHVCVFGASHRQECVGVPGLHGVFVPKP